jgi:hypothetical protein
VSRTFRPLSAARNISSDEPDSDDTQSTWMSQTQFQKTQSFSRSQTVPSEAQNRVHHSVPWWVEGLHGVVPLAWVLLGQRFLDTPNYLLPKFHWSQGRIPISRERNITKSLHCWKETNNLKRTPFDQRRGGCIFHLFDPSQQRSC